MFYRTCIPGCSNLRRNLRILPTTMRLIETTGKSLFIVGLKVNWKVVNTMYADRDVLVIPMTNL